VSSSTSLFLYQELALLALDDKKGTLAPGFSEFVVVGAILAELLLENKILIEKGQAQLVRVINFDPVEDPTIDKLLTAIKESKKELSLELWVSNLAGIKNIMEDVIAQLCEKILFVLKNISSFIFLNGKVTRNWMPHRKNY